MPELPEVEITLQGIAPHLTGQSIRELVLRTAKLRQPLDVNCCYLLPGQMIQRLERRAKYLLLHCDRGALILHLGMSGHLRVLPAETTEQKHDHIDLILTNGQMLRFTDPRKFGLFIYTEGDVKQHRLLKDLGPEPLSADLSPAHLYARSRQRRQAIKPFIMDQKTVVGVGNIYASEALFRAGINPRRAAGGVGRKGYVRLVAAIREVLTEAIAAGGTTISDFTDSGGRPGFFDQQLRVYARAGLPCLVCDRPIKCQRLGQRSTFFCSGCQT
jgi:formamidopyrimidine-DNA glycosylase